jgi:flagellar biosynthesis protein FliQ
LILVVVAFGLLANFMMVQLADYFSFIFDQVAQSA